MKSTRLVLSNNFLAHPKNHETAYRRGKHWNRRRQSGTSLRHQLVMHTYTVGKGTYAAAYRQSLYQERAYATKQQRSPILFFFLPLFYEGQRPRVRTLMKGDLSQWCHRGFREFNGNTVSYGTNVTICTQLRKQICGILWAQNH